MAGEMGGRQGPANVRVVLSVTGYRPTFRPRSGRGRPTTALRNRLGRATDSCGPIPARGSREGPLAMQPTERRRRRDRRPVLRPARSDQSPLRRRLRASWRRSTVNQVRLVLVWPDLMTSLVCPCRSRPHPPQRDRRPTSGTASSTAPLLTRNWIVMQTRWLAERTRNTPRSSRSIGPDSIPTASRGDAQRECHQTHMRSESPVDSTGIEALLKPVSRYEDYVTELCEFGCCMSYQFSLHEPTERPTESAQRNKTESGKNLGPSAQVELFIVPSAVLFFPNPSHRRSGWVKPNRWSSGWVLSSPRSCLSQ